MEIPSWYEKTLFTPSAYCQAEAVDIDGVHGNITVNVWAL